jgi:hypothetical protein
MAFRPCGCSQGQRALAFASGEHPHSGMRWLLLSNRLDTRVIVRRGRADAAAFAW